MKEKEEKKVRILTVTTLRKFRFAEIFSSCRLIWYFYPRRGTANTTRPPLDPPPPRPSHTFTGSSRSLDCTAPRRSQSATPPLPAHLVAHNLVVVAAAAAPDADHYKASDGDVAVPLHLCHDGLRVFFSCGRGHLSRAPALCRASGPMAPMAGVCGDCYACRCRRLRCFRSRYYSSRRENRQNFYLAIVDLAVVVPAIAATDSPTVAVLLCRRSSSL